jgi:hypothetical protein
LFGWLRKRNPSPFVGTWDLTTAADAPPASLDILAMRLVVSANGSFSWETSMIGPWEGVVLQGEGRWILDGTRARITAGKDIYEINVQVGGEGLRLILDPDIVLRRDGEIPIPSEYTRVTAASP